MMAGINISKDGQLRYVSSAKTIDEVIRRTNSLRSTLVRVTVHANVLKYCVNELLEENYFHAVFEAAKSLSDRVREMTGLTEDGSNLFNRAFSCKDPWVAVNRLSTDTERNQ
jgi:hypothetical protein